MSARCNRGPSFNIMLRAMSSRSPNAFRDEGPREWAMTRKLACVIYDLGRGPSLALGMTEYKYESRAVGRSAHAAASLIIFWFQGGETGKTCPVPRAIFENADRCESSPKSDRSVAFPCGSPMELREGGPAGALTAAAGSIRAGNDWFR